MDARDIVEQLQDACDLATDKRELERLCGNAKTEIERMRSLLLEAVDLFGDAQSGYIPGCGWDLQWIERRNSFFEAAAAETPKRRSHRPCGGFIAARSVWTAGFDPGHQRRKEPRAMSDEAKAEAGPATAMTAGVAAVPPAPTIEVPAIQREGYSAILAGRTMREPAAPEGFTFCQYPLGSVERENFLAGCARAVFKGSNATGEARPE